MITNETIESIIAAAADNGFDVAVEDIQKAVLARHFEDRSTIDSKGYFETDMAVWLEQYVSDVVFGDAEISFEDNRKAMLELIEKTKRDKAAGRIEAKDALKIEADLRVKLNDKFKVQDDTRDKVVFVEKKYNMVCRHGYECYLPTKADLMEMYNLVEKE